MSVTASLFDIDHAIARTALMAVGSGHLARGLRWLAEDSYELKGVVPALAIWHLWFRRHAKQDVHRMMLIAALAAAATAIAIGRVLANFLPFRPRPLATIGGIPKVPGYENFLSDWSSMPSDHALFFFALAGGVYLISRRIGLVLFVHALVAVSIVRVLIGFHYVSDIVMGAIVGLAVAITLTPLYHRLLIRLAEAIPYRDRLILRPEIGYPFMFLVTFQFATMFDGSRLFARRVAEMLMQ